MKTIKSTPVGIALEIAQTLFPDTPTHTFGDWMVGKRVDGKMDRVRERMLGVVDKMWWMDTTQLHATKEVVEVLKEKFPGQPHVWRVGVNEWVEGLWKKIFH